MGLAVIRVLLDSPPSTGHPLPHAQYLLRFLGVVLGAVWFEQFRLPCGEELYFGRWERGHLRRYRPHAPDGVFHRGGSVSAHSLRRLVPILGIVVAWQR